VRSGPGPEYAELGAIGVGEILEIRGVSEDRIWYQVLLPTGGRGWVVASLVFVATFGDVTSLPTVVAPTLTPSPTGYLTAATHTVEPGPSTPRVPTTTTAPSYPCDARIIYQQTALLNVVRAGPSSRSSFRTPVQQGASIIILAKAQEGINDFWYQITDMDGRELGWIPVRYVVTSNACPE